MAGTVHSGEGWVILSPGGIKKVTLAWRLGIMTNNQAEVYVLYLGLLTLLDQNVKKVKVVGDCNFYRSSLKGQSHEKINPIQNDQKNSRIIGSF